MERLNEGKRELSDQFDSTISAVNTSKDSQDRDAGVTKRSDEINRILAACKQPHDLDLLIRLATSPGGLINDQVRKIACKSLEDLKDPWLLSDTDRY